MAVTIATAANYWISPTALSITLNALGEANRIQASVASGAAIVCYIRGVDGLGYDNGHNYRRWPLVIAPTYFNTNDEVYLYVAIPRSESVGTDALVVFPTKKLDIYGYEVVTQIVRDDDGHMLTPDGEITDDPDKAAREDVQGTRYGTDDYFYIWLQGIITSSGTGYTPREWKKDYRPQTGTLATDEALDPTEGNWYRWDYISQTVTFLKEIWMDTASIFANLRAKVLILGGKELRGVAVKGETPADSDDTIVTPAYLGGMSDNKYIRKDRDDSTPFTLGVGGDLNLDGDMDVTSGRIVVDNLKSHNYTGDGVADTGWKLTTEDGTGSSKLTIDNIYVRKKATFEELEVKKETAIAGNQIFSSAANIILRTDYYAAGNVLLGYSYVRIPWTLRAKAMVLGKTKGSDEYMRMLARHKRVRVTINAEQASRIDFVRCYFLAKDGEKDVENMWRGGPDEGHDLARCQTMNLKNSQRKTYISDVYESKKGNVFWWRKVVRVSEQPVTIDGADYHYFDVSWADCAKGSDIPAAGDHVVQFGNDSNPDRMNLLMLEINGSDAPCIKALKGVFTYSLSNSFWGGNPQKMKLSPTTGYEFYGPEFRIIAEYGSKPVPIDRGAWYDIEFEHDEMGHADPKYTDDEETQREPGMVRKCYYYDKVSHIGCYWLCVFSGNMHYVCNEAFENYEVGDLVPESEWELLSSNDKAKCTVTRDYTVDEPSSTSTHWLKQVDRGTSVKTVTVTYAKSDQGTTPPTEGWKTEEEVEEAGGLVPAFGLKDGDFLWTCTKTEYSDTLDATFSYSVSRWGIDGDGIASIDSYYLGTEDTNLSINKTIDNHDATTVYKIWMPGEVGYEGADLQHKWYKTFNELVAARDGLTNMQNWNVWQKTVIHYDLPTGQDTRKDDVVAYQCNRVGMDGLIGQEEYYLLASSNDFNTVFGSSAPSYDQIGIRWYKQSKPSEEHYRLSETAPNICTKASEQESASTPIWSPQMPVYNKNTHGNKIYLWNFEQRADGQGTQFATRPICIGNHARGITGVLELYALSASGTPRSGGHIPQDIYEANGNSETDYSHSDPTKPLTWTDEIYDRAPSEKYPYQWNWTRTLYSSNDADGKDYEDHYHVSAVRGTRGEDGAGREFIYCRPQSHKTDGTPIEVTVPSPNVLKDQQGNTVTEEHVKTTDDFVPYQWTDTPMGIDSTHQVEYQAERRSQATKDTGGYTGGHRWEDFSEPKPWSRWGKNGQDGDGVEFVFIRTTTNKAPTITNSSDTYGSKTYLDDDYLPLSSAGRCTDDPQGTSRQYPFEWCMKRTKGLPNAETGIRQWNKYKEGEEMSQWSNYAESSVRLDIDNEMDTVLTDSALKVTDKRTISTVLSLWDGSKKANIKVTDVIVSVKDADGATVSLDTTKSPSSGTSTDLMLSWTFESGSLMKSAYEISISYEYVNSGVTFPLSTTFTIMASKGKPVFQLMPSYTSLTCKRKEADNKLENPPALSLRVVKIDGKSSEEKDATSANLSALGVTVIYSTVSMPTSKSPDSEHLAWPGSNSVQAAATDDNVYIAMFNADGVLLDRETIPVVKQGEHGDSVKSFTKTYAISAHSEPNVSGAKYPDDISSWSATSPAVTEAKPYLWAKEVIAYKYKTTADELYYYVGMRGENGIDAQDSEWVYIRTKTKIAPVISGDGGSSPYADHNGNDYTKDDHLPKVVAGSGGSLDDIESDNSGSASKKYECTDTPKGLDETWKYEWEAKRKKAGADPKTGERKWTAYSGSMVLRGNLAESAFVIDLDNQTDQFGTDGTGKVLVDQKRSTTVSLYYGSQEQTLTALTASLKYEDGTSVDSSVATVTYSKTTGIVEVTVKKDSDISSHTSIVASITATCARGSLSATFPLQKTMGGKAGESPVIYQLVPTQKSFSFTRAANNSLTPDSRSSQINVDKTVGNNTEHLTTAQAGITYKWGWDTDSTAQASGLAVGSSITVSRTDAALHSSVWVELSTGDRETLPIVKDGTNGQTGYGTSLVLIRDGVYTDADWDTYAAIGNEETFEKSAGDEDFLNCRVGDFFVVTGTSSDSSINHEAKYKCTAVTANSITGICISHLHDGKGEDGTGYKTVVYRNNFTEATWNTYGTIGHEEPWSNTSDSRNGCRSGDWFLVVGTATDTGNYHILTYECDNDSGNLHGKCINHQITKDGDDGWMVSANPANVIITQGMGDSTTTFTTAVVGFVAKKGSKAATVSSISTPTSGTFNVAKNGSSGDAAKQVKVTSPKQSGSSYYTEGKFSVTVNVTDPDNTSSTVAFSVEVPCYANLLGTWKETVVADTKTEVANTTYYVYDKDGNVIKSQKIGEYIKSSSMEQAKLSDTVTTQGVSITNMNERVSTAEGNISTVSRKIPQQDLFNSTDWVINDSNYSQAEYDSANARFCGRNYIDDIYSPVVELAAGTYTFSGYVPSNRYFDTYGSRIAMCLGASASNRDGSSRIDATSVGTVEGETKKIAITTNGVKREYTYYRRYAVFRVSSPTTCCINLWGDSDEAIVAYPKLEKGSDPTLMTIDSASYIEQTADQIRLQVQKTGINITSGSIDLIAGKVNFKNSDGTTANPYMSIDSDGKLTVDSINATNGTFVGSINASKYLQRIDFITIGSFSDNEEVAVELDGRYAQMLFVTAIRGSGDTYNKRLKLPPASDYAGCTLEVYCVKNALITFGQEYSSIFLCDKNGNGIGSYLNIFSTAYPEIKVGEMARIHSNGTIWNLVDILGQSSSGGGGGGGGGDYIPTTEKGAANGVATLDLDGKVPDYQLPIDTLESEIMTGPNVKAALGTGTGTTKYLREDGTWQTPVASDTVASIQDCEDIIDELN